MRHVGDRALELAKAAVIGYLVAFAVCIFAILVLSTVALVIGQSSLKVGIGPIPLMSFWNSNGSYGSQSLWGIGAFAGFGAVAGLGCAVRRQLIRAA